MAGLTSLFVANLPSMGDGAPTYLSDVTTAMGVRDVLFFQTEHSHALALDAHTGAVIWRKDLPTGCFKYSDSAMAVDPGRQFVYAVGTDCKVHKLSVADGSETTTGGWPETVATNGGQKVTSELGWATDSAGGATYLYTTLSYAGQTAPGSLTGIDLATGAQSIWYFHAKMGGADAWNRAGAVWHPELDEIFSATADGPFNPAGGNWSMTLSAVNVNLTSKKQNGYPNDSYTPPNWQALTGADLDVGSTNVLVLPKVPGSKLPHLGIQSGKSATLWLINLDDMSGQGGPGHAGGELQAMASPQGQGQLGMMGQPAAWTHPGDGSVWAFCGTDAGIAGIQIVADAAGTPSMQPVWHVARSPVQSPIVANGVLYYASGGSQSGATGAVYAADATTGTTLWSAPIAPHHWSSPVVVNGVLYMPDGNGADQGGGNTGSIKAFALPGDPGRDAGAPTSSSSGSTSGSSGSSGSSGTSSGSSSTGSSASSASGSSGGSTSGSGSGSSPWDYDSGSAGAGYDGSAGAAAGEGTGGAPNAGAGCGCIVGSAAGGSAWGGVLQLGMVGVFAFARLLATRLAGRR